jgi:CubicO group peptidase (beta-lactamase class C family)
MSATAPAARSRVRLTSTISRHEPRPVTAGRPVLPAWWLRDTLTGDPDSRDAFAVSPTDTRMPGGMYRNTFWVPYPAPDVLLCLGIHGQMVYINTAANVAGVKLSSWPVPQDPVMLSSTLRAFDAIAEYLGS